MRADKQTRDREAEDHSTGQCSRPYEVQPGLFIRCKSRVKSKCVSCAELYRGDWAAIARSGIFDGPVEKYAFYLLTLTAPSFGRVHTVSRSLDARARLCGCGLTHTAHEGGLRGVPLDPASYDYGAQVAWNRDSGTLWDRTRRRLRDRWDSVEYFIVREWQERGALHAHVLVRISRSQAPSDLVLGEIARSAVAASNIDGSIVGWGEQSKCDSFRVDGDGAKTIWYLSKALNYIMKDTARPQAGGRNQAWTHLARLESAARAMRCSAVCFPSACTSPVHGRYGARSHVVSASRRTKRRTGWSFTGLTRTIQRRLRKEWFDAQEAARTEQVAADCKLVQWAHQRLAARLRLEMGARSAEAP